MNFAKRHPRVIVTSSTVIMLAAVGAILWPRLNAYFNQRSITLNYPRIACDEPDFDFGKADTGATVRTSFVIRNDGGKALTISEVKPECGCTVANLPDKVIAPGKSLALAASLSLRNLRGKQKHKIVVTSDDPKQPQLVLSFHGMAESQYELKPAFVNFPALVEDAQESQTIELIGNPGAAWKIDKLIPSKPELFNIRAEPLKSSGYRLHVTFKAGKRGRLYESFRVVTDNPKEPEVTVPVFALVAGELGVTPDRVDLNGQQEIFYLLVSPSKMRDFKIERVETPAAITADILPVKDKRGYHIRLGNVLRPNPAWHGQKLKIVTDVKGMEEILVPIHVAQVKAIP